MKVLREGNASLKRLKYATFYKIRLFLCVLIITNSRRPSPEPVDDLREIHDHLLNHIILPRFLPDKLPEMDDNHESYLMNKFLETIKDCAEWIPDRTTEAMKAFKKTHDNRTGESISEQIKKLEPGHTFSMLIKNQKCVFMIHVPYDDINENETNVVQIATFPSCVIPNEMYKSNFHVSKPKSKFHLLNYF